MLFSSASPAALKRKFGILPGRVVENDMLNTSQARSLGTENNDAAESSLVWLLSFWGIAGLVFPFLFPGSAPTTNKQKLKLQKGIAQELSSEGRMVLDVGCRIPPLGTLTLDAYEEECWNLQGTRQSPSKGCADSKRNCTNFFAVYPRPAETQTGHNAYAHSLLERSEE
nr:hypothetical protein Iba_chr09dCG0290 [Ipomoea batatas]